jgi:hypothetical protein
MTTSVQQYQGIAQNPDIDAITKFVCDCFVSRIPSEALGYLQKASSYFHEARMNSCVIEGTSFGLGSEVLRVLRGGAAQSIPEKCSLTSLVIISSGQSFRSAIDSGMVTPSQFGILALSESEIRLLGDKILQIFKQYPS